MQLPVWCECGRIVTYGGEDRCEDCWADEQKRLGIRRNGTSKYIDNVCMARLPGPEVQHVSLPVKVPPTAYLANAESIVAERPGPDRQPE